jgi:prepilin-type processing-associated H-X9-DG protein
MLEVHSSNEPDMSPVMAAGSLPIVLSVLHLRVDLWSANLLVEDVPDTFNSPSNYCLNNNMFYTSKTATYDCLGTYHRTRGGDLNSGIANIVFVDGSVGTGNATDSVQLAIPKK